ncbi:MAG: ribulose-phosphate 3-epimerase [Bacteriovoracia bacterium]
MIIAPSLLSANFLELGSELRRLETEKDVWLHLDIMDGHFVPNLTFGPTVLKNIRTVSKLPLDAHFMVTNPDAHLEWFKDVGLHNFTFHWEAEVHHDRFIQKAKSLYPSVGISLNPSTPLQVIPDYILKKVDLVLLMSVNPGFGGQSFIAETVEKVRDLAAKKTKLGAHFEIQVDGGITDAVSASLASAGATNLVAGSYIFNEPSKNYSARIAKLR